MTAAARTAGFAWLRSIAFAGFNAGRHNRRRLQEYLGPTPHETRANFEASIELEVAPSKDYAAWLGEVIVHGQDIARPLGLPLTPDSQAVVEVAKFFVAKDFTVKSATVARGLKLEATDADFSFGSGELVRGPLLGLVMALAGRGVFAADLTGPGASELARRIG